MRLFTISRTLLVLAGAVVGIAFRSEAGIITVPPGLSPGDTYRLVFVTSGTTTATSTDINDYNTFVSNAANAVTALADLNATWTVIGSTSTTDARDNIGHPDGYIYSLSGTEVCNSTGCLFSGSLYAPINTTELGATSSFGDVVWTGSNSAGTEFTFLSYFQPLGSTGRTMYGIIAPAPPYSEWLCRGSSDLPENSWPLYAISSQLTVPNSEVPESTTIGLTALGGAILLFAMRRKQVRP